MQNRTWWKRYGLSVFLVISIMALLLFYNSLTYNLPAQIYTPDQQDLLSYSRTRSLLQAPIVTNRYAATGFADGFFPAESGQPIVPANFSVWENQVEATLDAGYEEENGVSVTKYDLEFSSEYHFQYAPTGVTSTLEILFPFPSNLETLNDVSLLVDGEEPPNVEYTHQQIRWLTELSPGDEHDVLVHYRADGVGSFTYGLSQDRRTDMLDVAITVNGLRGSDVPNRSLPMTSVVQTDTSGEELTWRYDKLLANRDIELTLPRRLSFAQRVAALQDDFRALGNIAPLLVGLFLVSLVGLMRLKDVRLDSPTYLLTGLGLTLFYPLLTFTSGLVGGIPAAVIAVILVAGLLALFLSRQVEERGVVSRLLWLLFIFLGLFSLGILTPYRGILLTLGGFLLVGTFMLAYARRPSPIGTQAEVEAAPTFEELPASQPDEIVEPEIAEPEPESEAAPIAPEPSAPAFRAHCPQCGRGLEEGFDYCPGCGYDARQIEQCPTCYHEQIAPETSGPRHCVHCGAELFR